jgi:hypothetical protein
MKSLKIAIILVTGAFATAIGCGSDSNNNTDAPVISGTGGSTHLDAGLGGTSGAGGSGAGGSTIVDASISTGGTTGFDGGADKPMGVDVAVSEAGGEAGTATNICTGLTAAACDLAIRNAAVDSTVTAQTVPTTNPPPAYSVCSQ